MNKQAKLEAWKKLLAYFISDFRFGSYNGLCVMLNYDLIRRNEDKVFTEDEVKFLKSEIKTDLYNKYGVMRAYLFPIGLYEPRLKYLTDKIAAYEQAEES